MIKTFKEILTSKVVSSKMKWKNALKASMAAMNNHLHNSSTKLTPH